MSLIVAVLVVAAVAVTGSAVARALGQPSVVGQLTLGILIGPLAVSSWFSDPASRVFTHVNQRLLHDVGLTAAAVLLFCSAAMHRRAPEQAGCRDAVVIALGNVVTAVGAGLLTVALLPHVGVLGVTAPQAAFLVVAYAVCALPVMVRMVAQNGLAGTRAAHVALQVGMTTDVVAWCALALLSALNGSRSHASAVLTAIVVLASVAAYRPISCSVGRLLPSAPHPALTLVMGSILAAGAVVVAGMVGLDPLLGALFAGLVLGESTRDRPPRALAALRRVEQINARFLLPVFFCSIGLMVTPPERREDLLVLTAGVTLLAIASRGVGTRSVARLTTLDATDLRTVAALTCARGATELALLMVGTSQGLLENELYAPMVLMAAITTIVAGATARPRRLTPDLPTATSLPTNQFGRRP